MAIHAFDDNVISLAFIWSSWSSTILWFINLLTFELWIPMRRSRGPTDTVLSKIEDWRRNLLDLSKRNPLINCRWGTTRGALRIAHPDLKSIWTGVCGKSGKMRFVWKRELLPKSQLDQIELEEIENDGLIENSDPEISLADYLKSSRLKKNDLLSELNDKQLDMRLRRIQLRTQESLSEQGVHSLFLSFGLLKWYESRESTEERYSPLMLTPVELVRESTESPWELRSYDDEVTPNYCLEELLKEQFGLTLRTPPSLEELSEQGFNEYFRLVGQDFSKHKRWEVIDSVLLNNFSFQKITMWQDLGENKKHIAKHPLCRAIAGDVTAFDSEPIELPSADELDEQVSPSELHSILDCDSSQLEAIVAAKAGLNLVLDGPPGTGKSQTIANLIAEFLAEGKTVLFVSEKAAALEVVKRRLDQKNLGDFCLECHSHKGNKREVVQELGRCLDIKSEKYPDQTPWLEELHETRQILNSYVQELHRPRGPRNATVFETRSRLSQLHAASETRCRIKAPQAWTARKLEQVKGILLRLGRCTDVVNHYEGFPWRGCQLDEWSLSVKDEMHHHLTTCHSAIATMVGIFLRLVDARFLNELPQVNDIDTVLSQIESLAAIPEVPKCWLENNPLEIAELIISLDVVNTKLKSIREPLLKKYIEDIDKHFPNGDCENILKKNSVWKKITHNTSKGNIRETHRQLSQLHIEMIDLDESLKDTRRFAEHVFSLFNINVPDYLSIASIYQLCSALENALNAPPVPTRLRNLDWRVISQEVLSFSSALQTLSSRHEVLGGYTADVEDKFPDEAVTALSSREFTSLLPQDVTTVRDGTRHFSILLSDLEILESKAGELDRLVSSIFTVLKVAPPSSLTIGQINELAELLNEGLQAPSIPLNWLDKDKQQVAEDLRLLLDTHAATDEIRRQLDHYSCEVTENFPSLAYRKLTETDEWLRRVRPHSAATIREHLAFFDDLVQQLRSFLDSIVEVQYASADLEAALGVQLGESCNLEDIHELLLIGKRLLEAGPLRRGWFDDCRRHELKNLGKTLTRMSDDALAIRTRLEGRLTEDAFGVRGEELTQRGMRYESFLSRISLSYRSFRRELRDLYHGEIPATDVLLSDLVQLREYHGTLTAILVDTRECSDDLLWNPDGEADWQSVLKGLDSVDRIASLKIYPLLHKERLCDNHNGIVNDAIEACIQRLQSCLDHMKECYDATRRYYTLQQLGADSLTFNKVPITILFELLDAASESLRERTEALKEFRRILVPDADPLLIDVAVDQQQVQRLRKLREKRCELENQLGIVDQKQSAPSILTLLSSLEQFTQIFAGRSEEVHPVIMEMFRSLGGNHANTQRMQIERLHNELTNALIEIIDHLERVDRRSVFKLTTAVDPDFRSQKIGLLQENLKKTIGSIKEHIEALTALVDVLAGEADVRLTDLEEVQRQVHAFRKAKKDTNQLAQDALSANGISHQEEDFLMVESIAKWVQQYVLGLDEPLSHWTLAVLKSDDRDNIQLLLGQAKPILGRMAACLEKWESQQRYVEILFSFTSKNYDKGRFRTTELQVLQSDTDQALNALTEEIKKFEAIERVLKPDHNLDLSSLKEDVESIQEFRLEQEVFTELCSRLHSLGIDIVDERKMSDVSAAKWLKGILKRYKGRLPESMRRACSVPSDRGLLHTARKSLGTVIDDGFRSSLRHLTESFEPGAARDQITNKRIDDLEVWTRMLIDDFTGLESWVQFNQVRKLLNDFGLTSLLTELLRGKFAINEVQDIFESRFHHEWLNSVEQETEILRQFDSAEHERLVERFQTLDRQAIENGHCRIREKLLNAPDRPRSDSLQVLSSSELQILLREYKKQRRHIPLRELFRHIPYVLQRLKPCIMTSPLALSTYFGGESAKFDLVIFDEASQVRPYDAISAIYRGTQIVVAGDEKQLPPTAFFDRVALDEDSDTDTEGSLSDFESILDVCRAINIPRKRLRWHYRSKREALISFSNRHFYQNDLITFPSIHDADNYSAIRYVHVPGGQWKTGVGVNEVEAKRCAELVFEHIRNCPSKSLGVITFNQKQQLAVDDALYEIRQRQSESENFFDPSKKEPFFIKNLENVQGDERDAIILSIGYAFDENGTLFRRFGPLASRGGERRLNVAVTRAREHITLVASIRSSDLDVSGLANHGPRLLKSYLEFAEYGAEVSAPSASPTKGQPAFDTPFESEVFHELKSKGLCVQSQVGSGRYRIDVGITHPDDPGRFILGVECDGASYHSSKTARDRDRLRQSILEEELGWTLIRIWSGDWGRDPSRQVDRVIAAYEKALAQKENGEDSKLENEKGIELELLQCHPIEEETTWEPPQEYSTIDEVPDDVIRSCIQSILNRVVVAQEKDLIVATARGLKFLRTGKNIRDRIRSVLESMAEENIVQEDGENRWRIIG